HKEHCEADFKIVSDVVSATQRVNLADGFSYREEDVTQPNGDMLCTIVFSDGARETLEMRMDGTAIETYTDPDSVTEATGSLQEDGMDTIQFEDGTSETVDVDTEDTSDDSDSDRSRVSQHRAALGRHR